mgnify:FL=1
MFLLWRVVVKLINNTKKNMIENYKGWDITLSWSDKNITNIKYSDFNRTNKNKKWVGVDLLGHRIYGSSLNEIRRIIDYSSGYKS